MEENDRPSFKEIIMNLGIVKIGVWVHNKIFGVKNDKKMQKL